MIAGVAEQGDAVVELDPARVHASAEADGGAVGEVRRDGLAGRDADAIHHEGLRGGLGRRIRCEQEEGDHEPVLWSGTLFVARLSKYSRNWAAVIGFGWYVPHGL